MKKLIAMLSLASVSIGLAGNVAINWSAGAGFYFSIDSLTGILASGTGSTTAQLIYSLDGNVNDALAGGGTSGDDTIWSSYTITAGGNSSTWADFSAPTLNTTYSAGYIYARIFQDNSIAVGDWYYYTTPILLQDVTTPQGIQLNTDLLNGNAIDSGSTVAQVVPEPATFLLFGMGAMGAWLVRRNKLKAREEV